MGSGIDSAGETTNHGESGVSQLIGKLLGRFVSVMCRASRSDDANGMMIAIGQLTPDIEHDGWRMDLAQ